MDYMIWVVAIALFAYLLYAMYTTPPSSGCLSADLARAMDEKKKAEASRRRRRTEERVSAAAPSPVPTAPVERVAVEAGNRAEAELLRNPSTGETASVPTNYRFCKRWIKEAMVAEGLLDKVYANADLDAAAGEKVKAALAQFRALAKYRA